MFLEPTLLPAIRSVKTLSQKKSKISFHPPLLSITLKPLFIVRLCIVHQPSLSNQCHPTNPYFNVHINVNTLFPNRCFCAGCSLFPLSFISKCPPRWRETRDPVDDVISSLQRHLLPAALLFPIALLFHPHLSLFLNYSPYPLTKYLL